jgi:hypothetical protein
MAPKHLPKSDEDRALSLVLADTTIAKSLDMRLDKNDLVRYKVSEYEDKLEAKRDEIGEELDKLQENHQKDMETLTKAWETLAKEQSEVAAQHLKAFAKAAGIKGVVQVDIRGHIPSPELNDNQQVIYPDFKISRQSRSDFDLEGEMEIPASPAILKLVKSMRDRNRYVEGRRAEIVKIKCELANIGRLERKASAAMVRKILETQK